MHRSAARLFAGLLAFAMFTAPVAAQAGPSLTHGSRPHPHATSRLHVGALGVVPVRGSVSAAPIGFRSASSKKLEYHGGPVMRTSTTYVIYWMPTTCGGPACSVAAGYEAGINTYFSDAAAASGATDNVYSTLNQYYMLRHGHKKHVQYSQTFGGSVIDTTAFPANGCTGFHYGSSGVCLSDGQIRHEVESVMADQSWTGGRSHAFFVVLPSEVDTCYNSSSCAFTEFCAYHSAFFLGDGTPAIYANIPYAGTNLAGCASGKTAPNADDLDATLNSTSHEHREMTNDPFGTAWWDDQSGNEGSDQCAYKFGPTQSPGGPNNGDFNQVINGTDYLVQMEWSNKSLACKQSGS